MSGDKKGVVIIGGGPAGYTAAIEAARLGAQVTLIEKDTLGGTCVNRGCIPTKALLASVQMLKLIEKAGTFGVEVGPSRLDLPAVLKRKDLVVQQTVYQIRLLMKKNKINVIKGRGRISGRGKVVVTGETEQVVEAQRIILAPGSLPQTLSVEGACEEGVMTSDEALALDAPPQSLLIVGGGYVGLELAQIFHRMGTRICVVEMMPQLLPAEDQEIARKLEEILRAEGMEIFTEARVERIQTDKQRGKVVTIRRGEGELIRKVQKVLLAVGRYPDTEDLSLEKMGIAMNEKAIHVNERMETSVKGVYAIGDALGRIMLAHVAMAEGRCAARNAMGLDVEMEHRVVPRCIYTSPEVAGVGLTEKEAREKYGRIKIGRFLFRGNAKASILDETAGMVKVIAEEEYGEVLGIQIIGPHATEMIAEGVLGIQLEATLEEFASTIHAHPTLSEGILEASLAVEG
jgi:dihydrolipoamide dehydrogenase